MTTVITVFSRVKVKMCHLPMHLPLTSPTFPHFGTLFDSLPLLLMKSLKFFFTLCPNHQLWTLSLLLACPTIFAEIIARLINLLFFGKQISISV